MSPLSDSQHTLILFIARGNSVEDAAVLLRLNPEEVSAEVEGIKTALNARSLIHAVAIMVRDHFTKREIKSLTPLPKPKPHLLEMLRLWGRGMTVKQIAEVTTRTEGTVVAYLEQIKRELGASDRDEAVDVAVAEGFIEL